MQLDVLGLCLEIVKKGGGAHGVAEGRMRRHIVDSWHRRYRRRARPAAISGDRRRYSLRRQRVTSATPIATMIAAMPFCASSRPDKFSRPKPGKKTLSTMPKAKTNNVVVEPIACTMLSGANKSA